MDSWEAIRHLEDLDFADDLAFLSNSHEQIQARSTVLHNLSISTSMELLIYPAKMNKNWRNSTRSAILEVQLIKRAVLLQK